MKHRFNGHAQFTGGYEAAGRLTTDNLNTQISIPGAMGGADVGTNPDELLLGAATTCFIITLSVMFKRHGLTLADLNVKSTAVVDVTDGVFTYEAIHYDVTIDTTAPEDRRSLITRFVHKSEASCMITRALAGNVDVIIDDITINFIEES
ncbi:OsmC family protein [Macrococcus equipercicus]|uniref:OsmC family protein n=1 Tax=Macrococcus equipercicus TaxID=69967 RepID=A0A9Q9F0T2_9STAP|nr:OsmC family protein [Macrococcus equipercicus]KAA1038431.1 hypothetical protein ERX35_008780 [Macrococcus equipercicus]UTH13182.1 OsmC family protein [Macrococcus equipercicus]